MIAGESSRPTRARGLDRERLVIGNPRARQDGGVGVGPAGRSSQSLGRGRRGADADGTGRRVLHADDRHRAGRAVGGVVEDLRRSEELELPVLAVLCGDDAAVDQGDVGGA